jgi:hypothetical protein
VLDCGIELGLPAADDEDVRPLGDEPLSGGETDAAIAFGFVAAIAFLQDRADDAAPAITGAAKTASKRTVSFRPGTGTIRIVALN